MATFIEGVTDIFPEPKYFTPDFSFIDKMLKRKEGMYEEGFSKLNNQYNLINRDVTNAANAAIRDEFLKKAKMNLKDLSALDLSDPSNVAAAGDVFKPFYTNRNVIGDQSITQHWNQQTAIGNSFRLKDGGKEFSQDNLDYINQQRIAFAADDPSRVDDYLNNKRYYNPYYDYNKEIKDVMKDFKPTHTKVVKMEGMYKKTIEDESWNKLEIAQYLNSVLSDKAKQQMRIEGSVRLGGDSTKLAQLYLQTEGAQLPKLNDLINKVDGQIAIEKDPAKVEQLKKYKSYYEDQRSEIGNNIKMIRAGDLEFLKRNGESLAFKTYYNALVDRTSNGYSHTDIQEDVSGDEVAMMYFKNDQDWKRTYYTQSKEDARERRREMREDLKAEREAKKDWSTPITVEMGGTDLKIYGKTLTNNLKSAETNRVAAYSNLTIAISKDLKTKGINVSPEQITEEQFNAFIKDPNNQKNSILNTYRTAAQNYEIAQQAIEGVKQSKEDYIKTNLGSNYDLYNKIAGIYKDAERKNQNSYGEELATGKPRQYFYGDMEAAKALNISVAEVRQIMQSANTAIKEFNEKKNEPVTKNVTGQGLLPTDSRYKAAVGYLESTFGAKDVTGVQFYPDADPSKFTILFQPSDAVKKDTDDARTALLERLKQQGVTATYNEVTKNIIVTGLGEQIAAQIDPYYSIQPIHRTALSNVNNWNGAVGSTYGTGALWIDGADGKQHYCNVVKTMYNGSELFTLVVDGKKMGDDNFNNSVGAYEFAKTVLTNPELLQRFQNLK